MATSQSKAFNQFYTYDGVRRLREMQCWSLKSAGNWKSFRQDTDGDGIWHLVQARVAESANEIADITDSAKSARIDPACRAADRMTMQQ